MTWRVVTGDCVEEMRKLDEASVDAVVCDPPYGLEFMGKEWDSFKTGRSEQYVAIAEARIAWWHKHRGDGEADRVLAAGRERDVVELAGQVSLFDEEAA